MKNSTISSHFKPFGLLLLFPLLFFLLGVACESTAEIGTTRPGNNPQAGVGNPTASPNTAAKEIPVSTPTSTLTGDRVYIGTATITHYYQNTCVNEGEATLTLKTDGTLLLEAVGPDVTGLCELKDGKLGAEFKGAYDPESESLLFMSSASDITGGTGNYSETEASGTVYGMNANSRQKSQSIEVNFKVSRK